MRIFSAFGILGLLHVARGGELDSFASDRARHIRDTLHGRNSPGVAPGSSGPEDNVARNLSEPIDLPLAFRKVQERSEHHRRAIDKLDIDEDGHVNAKEVLKSFEFWWGDAETVQRMLHTFGFANVEDALKEYTAGGDRVSKSDLFDLAETRPYEGAKSISHCPAVHNKIESCPLYTVNRCSKYLHAAETFCGAGYKNIVETCIMSASCSNICECIESAEKAAHGEGAIAVVDQQGMAVVTDMQKFSAVGFPETGLQTHPKRWVWLIYAIIVAIVGIQIDLAIRELTRRHEESRWLNSEFWDGKGLPPACSVYVFWGGCGYIGTGTARNCPDGGERVYGNSCKDHWRYGSKACGVLGAKCQSLCVKVNPSGCPCSMFDWAEFDDQDMPGSDIRSFFTQKVSECRDACGKDTNCKAFVITPPKGNKDESPNCWLKNAQRPTMRSDGATTFFRKGSSDSGACSTDIPITSDGAYDGDWWPGESTTKRDSVDVVPRAGKGDKVPFPFNRNNDDYTVAIAFLVALYRGFLATELTYQNHNHLRAPIGAATIDRNDNTGIPDNAPYASYNVLPRWTGPEIGYRITAVFRNLFNLGRNNVDDPVRQYLANSPANSPAATAQFPQTVRDMLVANSAVVHSQSRGTDIWIGTNRAIGNNGGITAPFQGLQAGYDRRLTYWQRGNAGPFSLEAAFILATQLAGVNFRNLARAAERPATGRRGDPWWMGVLTTARSNPQCLNEETANGVPTRRYGRYMPADGTQYHDPEAGVYVAFDLNPNLPEDSPNRNVFVFVVHAIDRNSVVRVPDARYLTNINLSTYTPGNDKASSYFWNGGSSSGSAPAAPGTGATERTRVFAHAHAAIVPYNTLQTWLASQGSQRFPIYTQIGYNHFYILSEDDPIFERNRWLGGGGNSGSS